jgi:hypothetical protein
MIVVQAAALIVVGIGVLALLLAATMMVTDRDCYDSPRKRMATRIAMVGIVVSLLGGIATATVSFAAPRSAAPPAAHVRSASTSRPSVSKSGAQR